MPPRGFFRIFMIQGFKNEVNERMRKGGMGKRRITDPIYILTLKDCSYCHLLIDTLSRLRIPFTNIDIDQHSHLGDKIEIEYGTDGYYPIINYGETVLLPHSNLAPSDTLRIFQTIDEALEILIKDNYEI